MYTYTMLTGHKVHCAVPRCAGLCCDKTLVLLQDSNLGQNLAVLRGHTAPINIISFHPKLPQALMSASNDGTVRLW